MKMETFNLVDQPWIPCITLRGTLGRYGLLQTLALARDFAEIRDSSPLVTISLYRLLLALLHRVFGPESPEVWGDLWRNGDGSFDPGKLETYLKSPQIYPRFDLFDKEHPFYQTAGLPFGSTEEEAKFVKPIAHLAHEQEYSDGLNLFSHFTETSWETRPPQEAACWLVAFQAFALCGLITTEEGRKKQDGSADAGQLVKSALAIVKGNNLFETLMFNLVHYSAEDEEPFAFRKQADKPAWERDDSPRLQHYDFDRRFDGYLDLLTWQSRRVRLRGEWNDDGKLLGVSGAVTMKGFQLSDLLRFGREAMVGFVRNKNAKRGQDPWPPLGFQNGKALWRSCHVLFRSISEESERPKNLKWVEDLRSMGRLNTNQVALDVLGLSSDQAKVFFWRHESWPLPLDYLKDLLLLESLKQVLDLAERVEKVLRDAVRVAAATALKPGKDFNKRSKKDREATDRVVNSLAPDRPYWARLENPFRTVMEKLASADATTRKQLTKIWYSDTLCKEAWQAFHRTAGGMESSSRALRAAVSGEECLKRGLNVIQRLYHFESNNAGEQQNNG